MKDFSISMALVDYIPVILFALAAIIIQRDLYGKMSKSAFALFTAGTINITCAGALKATYKLLYAAKICDFEALNAMFFPVQSIGFLLAGIGIILTLVDKRKTTALSVAPTVFSGTFVFVGLMVAGLGLMDVGLCIIAFKMNKQRIGVIIAFAFSFVCSLCMGYLSSQNFTQAAMNWIAECVNVVGQGLFFLGTYLLHKNGLKDFQLQEGEKV